MKRKVLEWCGWEKFDDIRWRKKDDPHSTFFRNEEMPDLEHDLNAWFCEGGPVEKLEVAGWTYMEEPGEVVFFDDDDNEVKVGFDVYIRNLIERRCEALLVATVQVIERIENA